MLDFFRRQAQSPYIQATIVIIILVFIFWGVGTNRGNRPNAVATVNGETIPFQDYQKEYDQTVGDLRDQFGGSLPKGLLDSLNIKQQVVNKLIQRALIRQAAAKAGLYVSDAELRDAIQDMEVFKNNGVFDKEWYKQVLTQSRMTVGKFEAGLRHDLLSNKVISMLSRFSQVSPIDIQALFDYLYEEMNLAYATFSPERFEDKVEVTDDGLAAFFEQNKDTYKTPKKIKISYLLFTPDMAKGIKKADDEDISRYYQANIDRFSIPEQRRASHILIRTEDTDSPDVVDKKRKQARDLLERIKGGEEFEVLAKMYSDDKGSAERGGDLGYFSRGQMVPAFEEAVFAMRDRGELSDIVKTSFGFHIIRLDDINPARTISLDEVKGQIAAMLDREKAKTELFALANKAYEEIILSGSLANYEQKLAASQEDATAVIKKTEFFSQQAPPEELRTRPALVNKAFSLKQGELSSIIETDDGYAIAYVEKVRDPQPQELEAVREQVVKDYTAKQARELARKAAESMLAGLRENPEADFAEAARAAGGEAGETGYTAKADFADSTVPSEVLEAAIALTADRPLPEEVISQAGVQYVVRFIDRRPPDQSLFEAKKEELRAQLARDKANELIAAWVENLRQGADISINTSLL